MIIWISAFIAVRTMREADPGTYTRLAGRAAARSGITNQAL